MGMTRWFATAVALAAVSSASVLPATPVAEARDLLARSSPDPQCTNGPNTRACWTQGFSIVTDFDKKHPTTGNTVTYDLTITNSTCNPDGNGSRLCFLINGQYPGPLIRASWGDTVVVNVHNKLQNNGTGIHFHGVRQLNSCGADGVNGMTQCPIAPNNSMTYTFQATQFGSSWYHSHFSSQYGDGVIGPIIFDGPATANYDVDLGTYMINDWYYQTAFQINALTLDNLQSSSPRAQAPPSADNILINGTNKNAKGGGAYNQVTISSGKRYRLRLVNPSVDNYIRASLDNHTFQIITSDFVPINPISADWVLMGPGQRYDVVITANQTAGNYWFRAQTANDCLSANAFYGRAIWTYSGVSPQNPTTNGTALPTVCQEPAPLAPYWTQPVPSGTFQSLAKDLNVSLTHAQVVPGGDAVVVWSLDQGSSMDVSWAEPTIDWVRNGSTNYPSRMNVVPALSENSWNYWLIQQSPNLPPLPHPIHLHGHDFFVLGQGNSSFNPDTANLNWATPPRRDTASIYGNGWLAVAFVSNNPGLWLMHCHLAWHISEGLGVQFFESTSSMTLPNWSAFDSTCKVWSAYEKTMYYPKIDSGL